MMAIRRMREMGDISAGSAARPVPGGRGSELKGLLEVILAMCFAGSTVVVGKLLSVRVPVFIAAELSLLAALAAVLPAQILRRRELRLLGKRELAFMALQALFGIVLFRVLTLGGLRYTTAGQAGLITSAAPAVMAVIAAITLRERIGRWGAAGIALTMAGLLLTNFSGLGAAPEGFLIGNLLVFGATVCEAFLTVFRKMSGGRIGSITNTTVLAAMSAAMLLPFALLQLRSFPLSSINPAEWAAILYYGAVATVIAYILWGHGSLLIPANATGIAAAAMPVAALVLSALFLGESLTPLAMAGCAAVVAGILVGATAPRA
jgi:drug/metabolite transporter (DMT)-like permease